MPNEVYYATLKDVAKRAGTTVGTASYALHGTNGRSKRFISEEMRARVEQAARELHYVKSSAASSLRGRKRKILAVLIPQFYNEFFTEMVLQIEKAADQCGYILSTCNTFDDPAREDEIIERMQAQRVDGYIIVPSPDGQENIRRLREMGVPLVILDRTLTKDDDAYHCILSPNYRSVSLAMQELFSNGHRKIAYIGWNADYGGLEQRERAYHDALLQAGIPLEEHIVYSDQLEEESGADMSERLLREHPEVTGVVYAANIQARGGLNYLSCQGIVPGRDLSVVIIGAPRWAQTCGNHFTCVDLGGARQGQLAASLLFDIIYDRLEDRRWVRHEVECALISGSSVRPLL